MSKFVENYFSLKKYVTSEGAVSHNIFYYQQLSITHYQVRFYVNVFLKFIPVVSTAFNVSNTYLPMSGDSALVLLSYTCT